MYKAGGSWQKIAWAAGSNFIGIGKVTKGLKVISKASSKSLKLDLQYFSKATSYGWIQKNVYNEIKNKLGKEAATKFSNAMKKGFVNSGKGDNGIKRLSGNGEKVGNKYYQYEIKITGKYGNARVYGNLDSKSGQVVFTKFVKSH